MLKKHREKIENKVRKSVSELRELLPVINEVEEAKSDVSDSIENDDLFDTSLVQQND